MSTTTVVSLRQPDEIADPLTAVLRSGARRLLAQAIEAEADVFLAAMKGVQLPDGRERLVRHGHGPERLVQTGIGPVAVQRVKLRDRGASDKGERIRLALVHNSDGGRGAAAECRGQAMRCETGMPSLVIRFSAAQAARASVF